MSEIFLPRDKGKPLNCTCSRSCCFCIFAMVALSHMSSFSGISSFFVDVAMCGSEMLSLIRRRRFRLLVDVVRDVLGIPCIRHTSFVFATPILSIAM